MTDKGEIILVDFWATWCGSCQMSIRETEGVKEELAKKGGYSFVYVTNESSPTTTWENLRKNIQGEHYRIPLNDWRVFAAKYKISGIPHYVVLGKDGKILDKDFHFSKEDLPAKLKEFSEM